MYESSCHIRFKNHAVYIHTYGEDHIVCFKYDDIRCDIEVFGDIDEVSDYIFQPFTDLQYYIEFPE